MTTGEVNYRLKADSKGFTSEVQKAERSVKGLDKQQKNASKSAGMLGKQSASINKLKSSFLGLGSVVAGLGISVAFKKMVDNTSRQEAALVQLNTTLGSTQFAAGKTADELTRTAAELQKVTKYGDEAIIEMQSLLLTFKDIKGDNFDRTSEAVLDMATAMKVDLKSATIQLGKALNDPTKNLSALSRAGITFSETQIEMIKQMQASGDMAGAQTMILKELESQFGGSARAARNTLGGALAGLSNAFNDLFEANSKTTGALVKGINSVEKAISSPQFKAGLQGAIDLFKTLFAWVGKVYEGYYKLGQLLAKGVDKFREWGILKDDLDELGEELTKTVPLTQDFSEALLDSKEAAAELSYVTVTATKRNTEFADSAGRATPALRNQANAVDRLQEVTVTAKRRNTEFAESSQDAAERSAEAWNQSTNLITGFLGDLVTNGKASFNDLLGSFKNMLAQMATEGLTNKVMVGVGLGGLSGAASAATGAAEGGLAGALSNPLVLAGAAAAVFGLDSVFGEKNNGNNAGEASFDLLSGNISSRGIGKSFDQGNVDSAQQLAESLQQLADGIGGSSFSGTVSVGNRYGVKLNGRQFSNPDELIESAFDSIVMGATNLSEELQTLILAFDGSIEETVLFAGAVKSLSDSAGIDAVAQAIEDFANASPSLGESLRSSITEVDKLIAGYDGSAQSAQNLSEAVARNKNLMYEFTVAIQQMGQEIAAISSDQAEYIRESILTDDELREKRLEERDSLIAILDTLTDPEEAAEAARRILELNRLAFDSLSEDQKLAAYEAYAQIAEDTNASTQSIFDQSIDRLEERDRNFNQALNQMLSDAAAEQQAAADEQRRAADRNMQAAQKNERAARSFERSVDGLLRGELI